MQEIGKSRKLHSIKLEKQREINRKKKIKQNRRSKKNRK